MAVFLMNNHYTYTHNNQQNKYILNNQQLHNRIDHPLIIINWLCLNYSSKFIVPLATRAAIYAISIATIINIFFLYYTSFYFFKFNLFIYLLCFEKGKNQSCAKYGVYKRVQIFAKLKMLLFGLHKELIQDSFSSGWTAPNTWSGSAFCIPTSDDALIG